MLAVAVADQPAGPFRFLGPTQQCEEHGLGPDLGLVPDIDDKGYIVYDDGHRNLCVDLLADDYLSSSARTTIALKSDRAAARSTRARP